MELDHHTISMRLVAAKALDEEAASLCSIMVAIPERLHQNEESIRVTKKGEFSFSIHAHHREVVARYSQVFVPGDYGAVGRFEFLAMPEIYSEPAATLKSLYYFDFNRRGEFILGGTELACDVVDMHKSFVRNFVVTHTVGALQEFLTA
jgi:hypothetical protein